ncbi:MAG: hypothetical protein QUS35_11000 [bacterium]|nr:hypothetical protein [bacterium]
MNIRRYMNEHEARVREVLEKGDVRDLAGLKESHDRMIRFMQHERLIHLLVLLAVASFFLLLLAWTWTRPSLPLLLLSGLFLVLLVPYILHYYFLENTVQRWYVISDEIQNREHRPKTNTNIHRIHKTRGRPSRRSGGRGR